MGAADGAALREAASGPPNAAAAAVGPTLAVIGGAGSGRVLAGRLGGRLEPVARLSRPLAAAQAFALGGTLYVLGGEQGAYAARTTWCASTSPRAAGARWRSSWSRSRRQASRRRAAPSTSSAAGPARSTPPRSSKFTPPDKVALVARLPKGCARRGSPARPHAVRRRGPDGEGPVTRCLRGRPLVGCRDAASGRFRPRSKGRFSSPPAPSSTCSAEPARRASPRRRSYASTPRRAVRCGRGGCRRRSPAALRCRSGRGRSSSTRAPGSSTAFRRAASRES